MGAKKKTFITKEGYGGGRRWSLWAGEHCTCELARPPPPVPGNVGPGEHGEQKRTS